MALTDSPADCVFCEIAVGRAAAVVVRRWPEALAITPRGGVRAGHLLVLPRGHVVDALQDPVVTGATMARAAQLGAELGGDLNLITSVGALATQTVPHLHVHLLPRSVRSTAVSGRRPRCAAARCPAAADSRTAGGWLVPVDLPSGPRVRPAVVQLPAMSYMPDANVFRTACPATCGLVKLDAVTEIGARPAGCAKTTTAPTLHPDLCRRRAPVLAAMERALQHRPTAPGDDEAFLARVADLVTLCLPHSGPGAPAPERPGEIRACLDLYSLVNTGEIARRGPKRTDEVFDGDLLVDGAHYQTPERRRGAYTQAPIGDASPRRLVARLTHAVLKFLGADAEHLAAAREVLQWAVDAPPLVREMVVRREQAARTRADIARSTGTTVSTVGHWESGQSIPHRQDWPALCAAYGFGEQEFARILAVTGPPERRGARRSAPPATAAPRPLAEVPPSCDCQDQARRVTWDAYRMSAVPVWQDAHRDAPWIGDWYLDLWPQDDAEEGPYRPSRSVAGELLPATVPPQYGVLGPVDLSALMHRQDWEWLLAQTSQYLLDRTDAHMTQIADHGVRPVPPAIGAAACDLAFAYRHALALHADDAPALHQPVVSVHEQVAEALAEVVIAQQAADVLG